MPSTALSPQPRTAYAYTTWKHGNLPVYREQNKWVVHYPDGNSKEYESGRALMRSLHNGRDPHLPVDRYFKKNKTANIIKMRQSTGVYQPTTLDLFEVKEDRIEIKQVGKIGSLKSRLLAKKNHDKLHLPEGGLGIDLANRGHEVRKLLFAGFGKKITSYGYDPEDVLQEVYKGLLARNMGKCPWDATKSSFGHYVHMVCGCIVSNYHRKYNRINMNERAGVRSLDDGETIEVDLASSNLCSVRGTQGDTITEGELVAEMLDLIRSQDDALIDGKHSRTTVSVEVLPLLVEGYKRRDISKHLGIREGVITRCINHIRKVCRDLVAQ